MEQHLPLIVAKKFWKMIRIAYFMLRKGVSKVSDLRLFMKRGKIVSCKSASMRNVIFHHHHDRSMTCEYKFSCDNSLVFCLNKGKRSYMDENVMAEAFDVGFASPVLPGFGPSPMVRQLRVTDSPFPLRDDVDEEHNKVDASAEEFIIKFYKDLKRQNAMA